MSKDVFITRTSAFMPLAPVGNEQMEHVLGMAGATPSRARRITLRNNGIKSRHYVIDPVTGEARYTNAQLTAEAVRGLVGEGFSLEDLTCLSTGTASPDQILPNHGVMVHGELGSPACEVTGMAGICMAGMTALKYAWMAVLSGEHASAVATGSEAASLRLRSTCYEAETRRQVEALEAAPELAFEKDFLRWMLSDAAGALLLQSAPTATGPSLRIDWMDLSSQAHEMPVCMYSGADKKPDGSLTSWTSFSHEEIGRQSILAIKQDVRLLNTEVVLQCLEKPLARIIGRRGLKAGQIDWFLPHMSSEYFRAPIIAGLGRLGFSIPEDRWFTNLSRYGNTGSASIYVMIDELFRSGRLQAGQRILCFVPESGRFSSAFMHLTVV